MTGTVTGWAALAIALATGAYWFRLAYDVNLPNNRSAFAAAMTLAAGVGIAAFARGAGWSGGVPAGVAIFIGALFLFTIAIGDQKGGPGQFKVGKALPRFTALDDTGTPFDIPSLAGNALLLKFFRGHW